MSARLSYTPVASPTSDVTVRAPLTLSAQERGGFRPGGGSSGGCGWPTKTVKCHQSTTYPPSIVDVYDDSVYPHGRGLEVEHKPPRHAVWRAEQIEPQQRGRLARQARLLDQWHTAGEHTHVMPHDGR